jgi:hypothetical protein
MLQRRPLLIFQSLFILSGIIRLSTGFVLKNLNPIENLLFRSSLEKIESATQEWFEARSSTFNPSLVESASSPSRTSNQERSSSSVVTATAPAATATIPSDIILIFHGAGGPDQFTDELQSTIEQRALKDDNDNKNTPKRQTIVQTLNWQEYSGSLLTAALNGEMYGQSTAKSLWKLYSKDSRGQGEEASASIRSVHCIGVSVGAFAANACATELCSLRKDVHVSQSESESSSSSPYVRLTLLDPFTSRGVMGSGYGSKNFGLHADYAEQYLNTDDPVPTTNDPLPLCACIDVTGAPERDGFVLPENESMHCWPLVYFARYGYEQTAPQVGQFMQHGKDGCPLRGSVEVCI